jgi:hypothetical protein
MKSFVLLLAVALTGALPSAVLAQDCGLYFDLRKGGTYELTTYDGRNEPTGRITQKILDAKTTAGRTQATVHQEVFDKKDKLSSQADYTVECQAGIVRVDMRALLNAQSMQAYKDMDAKVTGDFLEIPARAKPGTSLKDGTMNMALSDKKSGTVLTTVTIAISNRKVEAVEPQKTPAGSFSCTRISQDMQMTARTAGLGIPFTMHTVEWYAAGVGTVRAETYRKDRLMSYTLLTAVPQ